MMKNKFLFLMILGLAFFASCSDDDKDPFKNYSADFSGDKLALKLNGKEFSGMSVSFNSKNKKNATLTLNALIPGEPVLELTNLVVEELSGDDYTFIGENKNDDRTVSVEGSVKSGVLSLNTNFKVTSKVVGKWMLGGISELDNVSDEVSLSPLHFELSTSTVETVTLPVMLFGGEYDENNNPIYNTPFVLSIDDANGNGFVPFVQNIVKMLLPQYLYSIELKENGSLIATYKGINEDSDEPLVLAEGMVRYNVENGQIYLVIDITSLLGRSTESSFNIEEMLSNGIPLKLQIEEGLLRAYVDKDMMVPFMQFMPIVKGLVADMEPVNIIVGEIKAEYVVKFLDDISYLITTADKVELGLDLVPYVEVPAVNSQSFSKMFGNTVMKFAR